MASEYNGKYHLRTRVQTTNETPVVNLYRLCHSYLQQGKWKFWFGTSSFEDDVYWRESYENPARALDDGLIDSIGIEDYSKPGKWVNDAEAENYGPQIEYRFDEEEMAYTQYLPKSSRYEVTGMLAAEYDLLLHEGYRYLGWDYIDTPDFLDILTENEVLEFLKDQSYLIDNKISFSDVYILNDSDMEAAIQAIIDLLKVTPNFRKYYDCTASLREVISAIFSEAVTVYNSLYLSDANKWPSVFTKLQVSIDVEQEQNASEELYYFLSDEFFSEAIREVPVSASSSSNFMYTSKTTVLNDETYSLLWTNNTYSPYDLSTSYRVLSVLEDFWTYIKDTAYVSATYRKDSDSEAEAVTLRLDTYTYNNVVIHEDYIKIFEYYTASSYDSSIINNNTQITVDSTFSFYVEGLTPLRVKLLLSEALASSVVSDFNIDVAFADYNNESATLSYQVLSYSDGLLYAAITGVDCSDELRSKVTKEDFANAAFGLVLKSYNRDVDVDEAPYVSSLTATLQHAEEPSIALADEKASDFTFSAYAKSSTESTTFRYILLSYVAISCNSSDTSESQIINASIDEATDSSNDGYRLLLDSSSYDVYEHLTVGDTLSGAGLSAALIVDLPGNYVITLDQKVRKEKMHQYLCAMKNVVPSDIKEWSLIPHTTSSRASTISQVLDVDDKELEFSCKGMLFSATAKEDYYYLQGDLWTSSDEWSDYKAEGSTTLYSTLADDTVFDGPLVLSISSNSLMSSKSPLGNYYLNNRSLLKALKNIVNLITSKSFYVSSAVNLFIDGSCPFYYTSSAINAKTASFNDWTGIPRYLQLGFSSSSENNVNKMLKTPYDRYEAYYSDTDSLQTSAYSDRDSLAPSVYTGATGAIIESSPSIYNLDNKIYELELNPIQSITNVTLADGNTYDIINASIQTQSCSSTSAAIVSLSDGNFSSSEEYAYIGHLGCLYGNKWMTFSFCSEESNTAMQNIGTVDYDGELSEDQKQVAISCAIQVLVSLAESRQEIDADKGHIFFTVKCVNASYFLYKITVDLSKEVYTSITTAIQYLQSFASSQSLDCSIQNSGKLAAALALSTSLDSAWIDTALTKLEAAIKNNEITDAKEAESVISALSARSVYNLTDCISVSLVSFSEVISYNTDVYEAGGWLNITELSSEGLSSLNYLKKCLQSSYSQGSMTAVSKHNATIDYISATINPLAISECEKIVLNNIAYQINTENIDALAGHLYECGLGTYLIADSEGNEYIKNIFIDGDTSGKVHSIYDYIDNEDYSVCFIASNEVSQLSSVDAEDSFVTSSYIWLAYTNSSKASTDGVWAYHYLPWQFLEYRENLKNLTSQCTLCSVVLKLSLFSFFKDLYKVNMKGSKVNSVDGSSHLILTATAGKVCDLGQFSIGDILVGQRSFSRRPTYDGYNENTVFTSDYSLSANVRGIRIEDDKTYLVLQPNDTDNFKYFLESTYESTTVPYDQFTFKNTSPTLSLEPFSSYEPEYYRNALFLKGTVSPDNRYFINIDDNGFIQYVRANDFASLITSDSGSKDFNYKQITYSLPSTVGAIRYSDTVWFVLCKGGGIRIIDLANFDASYNYVAAVSGSSLATMTATLLQTSTVIDNQQIILSNLYGMAKVTISSTEADESTQPTLVVDTAINSSTAVASVASYDDIIQDDYVESLSGYFEETIDSAGYLVSEKYIDAATSITYGQNGILNLTPTSGTSNQFDSIGYNDDQYKVLCTKSGACLVKSPSYLYDIDEEAVTNEESQSTYWKEICVDNYINDSWHVLKDMTPTDCYNYVNEIFQQLEVLKKQDDAEDHAELFAESESYDFFKYDQFLEESNLGETEMRLPIGLIWSDSVESYVLIKGQSYCNTTISGDQYTAIRDKYVNTYADFYRFYCMLIADYAIGMGEYQQILRSASLNDRSYGSSYKMLGYNRMYVTKTTLVLTDNNVRYLPLKKTHNYKESVGQWSLSDLPKWCYFECVTSKKKQVYLGSTTDVSSNFDAFNSDVEILKTFEVGEYLWNYSFLNIQDVLVQDNCVFIIASIPSKSDAQSVFDTYVASGLTTEEAYDFDSMYPTTAACAVLLYSINGGASFKSKVLTHSSANTAQRLRIADGYLMAMIRKSSSTAATGAWIFPLDQICNNNVGEGYFTSNTGDGSQVSTILALEMNYSGESINDLSWHSNSVFLMPILEDDSLLTTAGQIKAVTSNGLKMSEAVLKEDADEMTVYLAVQSSTRASVADPFILVSRSEINKAHLMDDLLNKATYSVDSIAYADYIRYPSTLSDMISAGVATEDLLFGSSSTRSYLYNENNGPIYYIGSSGYDFTDYAGAAVGYMYQNNANKVQAWAQATDSISEILASSHVLEPKSLIEDEDGLVLLEVQSGLETVLYSDAASKICEYEELFSSVTMMSNVAKYLEELDGGITTLDFEFSDSGILYDMLSTRFSSKSITLGNITIDALYDNEFKCFTFAGLDSRTSDEFSEIYYGTLELELYLSKCLAKSSSYMIEEAEITEESENYNVLKPYIDSGTTFYRITPSSDIGTVSMIYFNTNGYGATTTRNYTTEYDDETYYNPWEIDSAAFVADSILINDNNDFVTMCDEDGVQIERLKDTKILSMDFNSYRELISSYGYQLSSDDTDTSSASIQVLDVDEDAGYIEITYGDDVLTELGADLEISFLTQKDVTLTYAQMLDSSYAKELTSSEASIFNPNRIYCHQIVSPVYKDKKLKFYDAGTLKEKAYETEDELDVLKKKYFSGSSFRKTLWLNDSYVYLCDKDGFYLTQDEDDDGNFYLRACKLKDFTNDDARLRAYKPRYSKSSDIVNGLLRKLSASSESCIFSFKFKNGKISSSFVDSELYNVISSKGTCLESDETQQYDLEINAESSEMLSSSLGVSAYQNLNHLASIEKEYNETYFKISNESQIINEVAIFNEDHLLIGYCSFGDVEISEDVGLSLNIITRKS